MHDSEFQEKIKSLKEKVESFAVQFPMPGLDDM
jgi:hypothetical protein